MIYSDDQMKQMLQNWRPPDIEAKSEPTVRSSELVLPHIERAVDALKYRVKEISKHIGDVPQYIAEVMGEGMENDKRAIEALEEYLRQNTEVSDAGPVASNCNESESRRSLD